MWVFSFKKNHAVHFFPVVFNEVKLCMHLKTGEVTLWELRFFDLLNENVIKCVLQTKTLWMIQIERDFLHIVDWLEISSEILW